MQQGTVSLQNIIDQVSKEKGIDAGILVETMEQAILTAAKRTFGVNRELEARFNDETGAVDLYQYLTVVDDVADPEREIGLEDAKRYGLEADEGEELGFQIFYMAEDADKARAQDKEFGDLLGLSQQRSGFGRIAAQTAKQVIIQRVRDAEREIIFNEFKDRRGEIVTGIVRRFERGSNLIVDLGRTEAVLPSRQQTPRESYRPGDRIVALLLDIDREARGPQVILSRTDVGLLIKLFEMEVPEIYEGIVRIVAAAREPGARSKIAVSSRDADVDPVGACVGMKGSRVQAVVQELRGEKIDIVPFDQDPARFVCNAIAPADVTRVIIDEANNGMELVVPDDKLSLAIGRRGQNVRLASQLTGWKLDIISEAKFRQIEEDAVAALERIEGIDENLAMTMYKLGFRTLDEVADASEEELGGIPGLGGPDNAASIKQRADSAMERQRREAIDAVTDLEALAPRERLMLVRGVTERIAEQLEQAGYRTLESLYAERDKDRIAIRAQLDSRRAAGVCAGIEHFVENELPEIRERLSGAAAPAAEPEPKAEAEVEASDTDEAKQVAPTEAVAATPGDEAGEGAARPTGEE